MPALQASLLGNGNAVSSIYDGEGVIPASSSPAGFAITSNYAGAGEVDLWSLVNRDANAQGFAFYQKTASGTAERIADFYSLSTSTGFELFGPSAKQFNMTLTAADATISTDATAGFNVDVGSGATRALTVTNAGRFILPISVTPSAANATGVAGTIAWDANFIYVCITTNTWKRVAIATWP